jgi:Uma2 family endonuclease
MSINTKLTYADYVAIPSDGRRHEIIDGEHFVNPAPNLYHQHVSRHLQHQLFTAIEIQGLGIVINAPVDLQLGQHDIVQPDLVVVTLAKKSILTPSKIKGAPDLVVEILSPSNTKYDTEIKRALYERSGVPEYWIVDPDEHSVLQLVLDQGVYRGAVCTNAIKMAHPPHTEVDLDRVW